MERHADFELHDLLRVGERQGDSRCRVADGRGCEGAARSGAPGEAFESHVVRNVAEAVIKRAACFIDERASVGLGLLHEEVGDRDQLIILHRVYEIRDDRRRRLLILSVGERVRAAGGVRIFKWDRDVLQFVTVRAFYPLLLELL